MGAIVKLGRGSFSERYLPIKLTETTTRKFTVDYHGVQLKSGNLKQLVEPKKKVGTKTEEELGLLPGSVWALNFGQVFPKEYNALVSVNQELLKVASVQVQQVLNAGEYYQLVAIVSPYVALEDLTQFDWHVQLNCID